MESSNCFNQIANQCEIYFTNWEGITNFKTNSKKENAATILKVITVATLIIPALVAITWIASSLMDRTIELISTSSLWNRMFHFYKENVMEYMDENWLLRMRRSAHSMQSTGSMPSDTSPPDNSSASGEGKWHYNSWHDEENNFCEKVLFSGGQLSINVSGANCTVTYPRTEKNFINEVEVPTCESSLVIETVDLLDSDKHLTPELLDYLIHHPLGLHHTSKDSVDSKVKDGFYGDSLNLCPYIEEVWSQLYPEDERDDNGWTTREQYFLNPNWISTEIKQKIISKWEIGVEDFIRIQLDVFSDGSSLNFLLVDYPNDLGAYDLNRYGKGLGKKGKQHIDQENILDYITLPVQADMSKDKIVEGYRSAVIEAISKSAKSQSS